MPIITKAEQRLRDRRQRAAQRQFIKDIMHSIQTLVLSKELPLEWNGVELRQYLADKFADSTVPMGAKNRKEYRNTCIVRNL